MLIKELEKLVTVLESYRGHDRFIRLATFGAMFMGGEGRTPGQMKWKTIASEMGACRVVLRLFDDLPMLLFNLSTGFGLKGAKPQLKPLELFTCLLNQSFYPVEHIGWLKQKKILGGLAVPYLLLGLAIWAFGLIADLIKFVIKMRMLNAQAKGLVKQQQLDKDGTGKDSQNAEIKDKLKKLNQEKKVLVFSAVQKVCDLINAISWFPPGFLWSGKLSGRTNGLLGIISTVIMLYLNWPAATRSS